MKYGLDGNIKFPPKPYLRINVSASGCYLIDSLFRKRNHKNPAGKCGQGSGSEGKRDKLKLFYFLFLLDAVHYKKIGSLR